MPAWPPREVGSPQVTLSPPGPYALNLGGTLRITAQTLGTAPFTFEWRRNDAPIPEQTSPELVLTATSTNQSGPLALVVRNAAGTVTTPLGFLTVASSEPGSVDYSFRPVVNANFGSASVTTFAFGPDGSVFLGGSLYSQVEA